MEFLEKRFKLTEHNTNVKTEILAGITTFMTMAYILVVNANILGEAGMDKSAVFAATAIAAFIGTMLMALLANYPANAPLLMLVRKIGFTRNAGSADGSSGFTASAVTSVPGSGRWLAVVAAVIGVLGIGSME